MTDKICPAEGCEKPTGRSSRYCSLTCWRRRAQVAQRDRRSYRRPPSTLVCSADGCARTVHVRNLCSSHYLTGRYREEQGGILRSEIASWNKNRGCKECGTLFRAEKASRGLFCSRDCANITQGRKRQVHENRAAERREHTRRRVARERAASVGQVKRLAIFERDNWSCYLCLGQHTDRRTIGVIRAHHLWIM